MSLYSYDEDIYEAVVIGELNAPGLNESYSIEPVIHKNHCRNILYLIICITYKLQGQVWLLKVKRIFLMPALFELLFKQYFNLRVLH